MDNNDIQDVYDHNMGEIDDELVEVFEYVRTLIPRLNPVRPEVSEVEVTVLRVLATWVQDCDGMEFNPDERSAKLAFYAEGLKAFEDKYDEIADQ